MGLPGLSVVIDTRDHVMEFAGARARRRVIPSGRRYGIELPKRLLLKRLKTVASG